MAEEPEPHVDALYAQVPLLVQILPERLNGGLVLVLESKKLGRTHWALTPELSRQMIELMKKALDVVS